MSKNELATTNPTELQIIPTPEDLAIIMEGMQDMDSVPFGRIQIAAAGAGVFRVTEPGEDEAVVATDITAVIIHNHRSNVLWLSKFGTVEDKTPDCLSVDGTTGIWRETGECVDCATCRYNQYGSADNGAGRGKACKNTRRLYLMREGDVLPLILHLPSTALGVFDKYRAKVMLAKKKIYGVVTKITLKNATNKDGIAYSTPVFDVIGVLAPEEAERARQYADGFINAMNCAGVYEDSAALPGDAAEDVIPF